ncbi:MAG TPA: PCP reductase family protein [Clostridia bacterium]|nr:PCP reductase family protein [Clostridia bacterium]
MNRFSEVAVLDNFYQTSSFYPMPVVLVTTVSENGLTNVGSYSLCFPFGIAGDHYMMLISRGDSNTSLNLLNSNRHCALNFIPYDRKFLKNAVCLGYPGETTEQKLKDCTFNLIPSMRKEKAENETYPEVIGESIQIFECTYIDDPELFHYANDNGERHFLLRIDHIFMQEKWHEALKKGGRFPRLPVDYGYRDSRNFWFAPHSRPYAEPIPKNKGIDVNTIKYEVQRLPFEIEWEEEAYARLVKVPRVFLKRVLVSISERAEKEGVKKITPELLDSYNKKQR